MVQVESEVTGHSFVSKTKEEGWGQSLQKLDPDPIRQPCCRHSLKDKSPHLLLTGAFRCVISTCLSEI